MNNPRLHCHRYVRWCLRNNYGVTMARLLNKVSCALIILVGACVSPSNGPPMVGPMQLYAPVPESKATPPAPKKSFHQQVALTIPLALPDGDGILNADVFRPEKKALPKTLIIIVPGSGNVSRKGEAAGDGVDTYPEVIEVSTLWAKALADRGYFVVTYDKRTCTKKVSTSCQNNSQKDLESEGISALARDLDQVYQFIRGKLSMTDDKVRLVLLTTTQGAQVVSLSESAKEASGVVLLSPIIGSLEEMWVGGLSRAHESAHDFNRKNRLANQKESMKGFFTSFNAGRFPDSANIRGASAQFWRTWMDASAKTVERLLKNARPTLSIFSSKDVFSPPRMIEDLKKTSRSNRNFRVKPFESYDRNFVLNGEVAPPVIDEVVGFVESLQGRMP